MQTTVAGHVTSAGTPLELASDRPPLVSEDWLAVLIGGALIALVLLGMRPANPVQMGVLVLVPLAAWWGARADAARTDAATPEGSRRGLRRAVVPTFVLCFIGLVILRTEIGRAHV